LDAPYLEGKMQASRYYQLHSFPNSQAAAGAVETATIEPMVARPPNSNAVQMIRVFMAVLQMSVVTTIWAATGKEV